MEGNMNGLPNMNVEQEINPSSREDQQQCSFGIKKIVDCKIGEVNIF